MKSVGDSYQLHSKREGDRWSCLNTKLPRFLIFTPFPDHWFCVMWWNHQFLVLQQVIGNIVSLFTCLSHSKHCICHCFHKLDSGGCFLFQNVLKSHAYYFSCFPYMCKQCFILSYGQVNYFLKGKRNACSYSAIFNRLQVCLCGTFVQNSICILTLGMVVFV